MSSTASQVVVGFRSHHSANAALFRAIALAHRAPFHVLHFVCVIEPHMPVAAVPTKGPIDYAYAERVQQALTQAIEQALQGANVVAPIHFFVHARIGKPGDEILELAREVGADLIIVGSKGATGLERMVLGSVSEHVVREAGCTVEVARAKAYAHVDLLEVRDVEPHHTYVAPHRYSYQANRLDLRPDDWPLY